MKRFQKFISEEKYKIDDIKYVGFHIYFLELYIKKIGNMKKRLNFLKSLNL
jgi:hypothetical protein